MSVNQLTLRRGVLRYPYCSACTTVWVKVSALQTLDPALEAIRFLNDQIRIMERVGEDRNALQGGDQVECIPARLRSL
jgi:hypothetical protein